jgi:3'-phosphoadenosine 5'-phosphosulfate sulfotransferase (PAPS reductase)/FAD synthetase
MLTKLSKFIAFSGGVESTTMCILYGKGAKAIWCDTGAEHKEMYKRMDIVEEKLKQLHGGDFEIIRITPEIKHKGEFYKGLENLVLAYKFMPSGIKRYCTKEFKIKPIDKYLKEAGECELLIGFNADESDRVGNLEAMPNINYKYPLLEEGYDRGDCEAILNVHGLHPKFPIYMSRGGCRMCFYKSEKEYKAMYFLNKDEFMEVVAFENAYQDGRKNFYSIMSSGKSLTQLAAECEREKEFLGEEQILKLYEREIKAKTCGAFCGR